MSSRKARKSESPTSHMHVGIGMSYDVILNFRRTSDLSVVSPWNHMSSRGFNFIEVPVTLSYPERFVLNSIDYVVKNSNLFCMVRPSGVDFMLIFMVSVQFVFVIHSFKCVRSGFGMSLSSFVLYRPGSDKKNRIKDRQALICAHLLDGSANPEGPGCNLFKEVRPQSKSWRVNDVKFKQICVDTGPPVTDEVCKKHFKSTDEGADWILDLKERIKEATEDLVKGFKGSTEWKAWTDGQAPKFAHLTSASSGNLFSSDSEWWNFVSWSESSISEHVVIEESGVGERENLNLKLGGTKLLFGFRLRV
jgi:hypothetical protein